MPRYVAGVNTPDSIINTNDTRLLTRGFSGQFLDPHHTDGRVQDWNLTIEKEIMANTVVARRLCRQLRRQAAAVDQLQRPDSGLHLVRDAENASADRRVRHCGEAAVRPDTYGNINLFTASGYGSYNGVQFELERRFSNGFAFQIFWVIGNTLLVNRDTDDTQAADAVLSINKFLPGAVPRISTSATASSTTSAIRTRPNTSSAGTSSPTCRSAGKKFGGNARGALRQADRRLADCRPRQHPDELLDPAHQHLSDHGNDVEMYGYKYPIEDCRSGACFPGYLWWNGYIPANRINSVDAKASRTA